MSPDEQAVAALAEQAAAPLLAAFDRTGTLQALDWRRPTVARTMSEAGRICGNCTHPWGRHVTELGCAAQPACGLGVKVYEFAQPTGDEPTICGCTSAPGAPA